MPRGGGPRTMAMYRKNNKYETRDSSYLHYTLSVAGCVVV